MTEQQLEKEQMAIRYSRNKESPPYAYKRLLNRIEGNYPDKVVSNQEWFEQLPNLEKEVNRVGNPRERSFLQDSISFHASGRQSGYPQI